MWDQIWNVIGTPAIIPAVMVLLGGYGISMLVGLHRTKSQQRTEFLALWKGVYETDDMALEVAVRHLCGTYIPARVIRTVCRTDHCADGIFEVAQLWPLLQYDRPTGSVTWAKAKYAAAKSLGWARLWSSVGYFLVGLGALACVQIAVSVGPKSLLGWLCGLNALLFTVIAFGLLARSDTIAFAQKHGPHWLKRLNEVSNPAASRSSRTESGRLPAASQETDSNR